MTRIMDTIGKGESQTVEFKHSFQKERYDYPLDAIREIVLNMIVHRDYRDSSDSVIKIFDDRIEFFNPGDLYDDLTIEEIESNHYI